ncbi:hypothetical protein DIPPA_08484 [Diplonema papillatum]|nr:hypothetical protein DIPPA_08484 [Diplonema papillatum]
MRVRAHGHPCADFEELVRSVSPDREGPFPRLPDRSADASHSDSADYAAISAAAATAAARASSTAATSAAAAAADPSAASSSAAAPRTPSGIPLPGTPDGDEEVARALQVDVQDTPATGLFPSSSGTRRMIDDGKAVSFPMHNTSPPTAPMNTVEAMGSNGEGAVTVAEQKALSDRTTHPAPGGPGGAPHRDGAGARGTLLAPSPSAPICPAQHGGAASASPRRCLARPVRVSPRHTPAPFSAPQPPAPVPAPTQPSQPAQENPFAGQHLSAPTQRFFSRTRSTRWSAGPFNPNQR